MRTICCPCTNKALTFVLTAFVVLSIQYGVFWNEITETSIIHYLIVALGDIAFILFPFSLLNGKWRATIWIPIIGFNVYWIINIIYFRTYSDLIPLSSFTLTENLGDVVLTSIKDSLYFKDIVYPLGVIVLCYIWFSNSKNICKDKIKKRTKIIITLVTIGWCFTTHIYREYDYYLEYRFLHSYDVRTQTNFQLMRKSYSNSWGEWGGCVSKKRKFYTLGILPHLALSAIHEVKPIKPLTDAQKAFINDVLHCLCKNNVVNTTNFSSNKGKNIIVIIVESLNSWALNFKVDGKSVLPNLQDLVSSGDAIVATNLISQSGPGRSSDGQLLINTGLFPLRDEATVLHYSDNNFPSLAKAFGNRITFEVICEEKSLWKHGITSKSEGYDKIYDIKDAQTIGLTSGAIEETMFQLAESVISKTEQPFFCTLITLAMHGPYKGEPRWKSWISDAGLPHDLTTYLEATHYFDVELGKFIGFLKENNYFDNSIIVITSDHESIVPGYTGKGIGTVPFIALNAGMDTIVNKYGGQIDVYPTILEITGTTDYWWKGFGTSILSQSTFDGALNSIGQVHGTLDEKQLKDYDNHWRVSEMIIKHNFFKDKENK